MDVNFSESSSEGSSSFQLILDSFLSSAGLPFSDLYSAERIARIFARHNGLFGAHGVYSTVVMVWLFLGQVLRDGKEASCQSAVARVMTYSQLTGKKTPTADTSNYCRARAVVVLLLATACVLDVTISPSRRKQTGETALLRRLIGCNQSWL